MLYLLIAEKEMVRRRSQNGDDDITIHWSDQASTQLLTIIADYMRNNPGVKIPTRQWTKWSQELSKTMGIRVSISKIQSRRDRFAKEYKLFKKLMNQSGIGWDPIEQRFDCDEEAWEKCVKVMTPFHK